MQQDGHKQLDGRAGHSKPAQANDDAAPVKQLPCTVPPTAKRCEVCSGRARIQPHPSANSCECWSPRLLLLLLLPVLLLLLLCSVAFQAAAASVHQICCEEPGLGSSWPRVDLTELEVQVVPVDALMGGGGGGGGGAMPSSPATAALYCRNAYSTTAMSGVLSGAAAPALQADIFQRTLLSAPACAACMFAAICICGLFR